MTSYPIHVLGFEGQAMEVRAGGFFSGPKLFVAGQPAPRGAKRGEMMLRRNDGTDVSATWKPRALGFDVPDLVIDGQSFTVVEPLKWYTWVWGGLPILLVFSGGALGGIAGAIGVYVNLTIFRSTMPMPAKFALSAVVTAATVTAYIVVAFLLVSALRR